MTPSSDHSSLITLKQWLTRVYVRSGMIQLLMIEVLLLAVVLAAFFILNQSHVADAHKDQERQMIQALQSKTDWISAQLQHVQGSLNILRNQAVRQTMAGALTDEITPVVSSRHGVLMKPRKDEGVSVYYSVMSAYPDLRESEVRRWLPLSDIMADIQHSNPLVKQVYLNTSDSLNLSYPFVDVNQQFLPDLDVTEFSFYYLAAEQYNPGRNPVWTDAYLDPAGKGWVISHIAPIYKGERLEAVVGVDLTIQGLINELFSTPQQWPGYGILVGQNGNILALPPEGEEDLGLTELSDRQLSFRSVNVNQFRPSQFNLYKRADLTELSRLVAHQQAGLAQISLNEPSIVAWNTVPDTGWKLLAVTREVNLYANAIRFSDHLFDIMTVVLGMNLMVFSLYSFSQYVKAKKMSRYMMGPLDYFREVIKNSGHDEGLLLNSPVLEIHQTAQLIQELASENATLQESLNKEKSQARQQDSYFRNVLNSIPLPVFDTDKEFRLKGCNQAFERFFGRSESELKHHLVSEYIPVAPPVHGVSQQNLTLTNAEGSGRKVNLILIRQSSTHARSATHPAVIGLLIDFSEQHQEHDQVRFDRDRAIEASQLQTEYLQAMRREIEQPLQDIRSLAERISHHPEHAESILHQLYEKVETVNLLAKDSWLNTPVIAEKEQELRSDIPGTESGLSGFNVLVVDDGPVNTMLARSVLQKVGYEVDVAFSGAEALDMMQRKQYQVVLMDIFMPDMDGIETTRLWRQSEIRLQRTPAAIIALTANVIESERQQFFDAGMNEYLAKPYHPSELRDRVDYWRSQYASGSIEV